MTNKQLWQAALGELELNMSKANFTTWFSNTSILSNRDGNIIIGVPNAFTKEWLQNKYHKDIIKALRNVTNGMVRNVNYEISVSQNKPLMFKRDFLENKRTVDYRESEKNERIIYSETNLNPKYTFETFVVGPSNELAQAACLAVSKSPGETYNPLFIYGGVGLGKTHLLQAIGNEVIARDANKKIKYITCERFTTELITSISNKSINNFKNKYKQIDILIIDDIQFLAGKEKTQEEFFHIFNSLYENNKQIVLSSDRPPKAIPTLEERLRSRFEGGMIADIGIPELETRIAILKEKLKEKNFRLSNDILNYIATNIQTNIRELEGALNRIIAFSQLNNSTPTIESTKNILANIIKSPKRKVITLKKIIETVSDFYDIDVKDIIGNSRRREYARPRQIAMYLMREEAKSSYPSIGHEMNNRDHTTAIHAYEKVSEEIENNESVKEEIDLIKQRLYSE